MQDVAGGAHGHQPLADGHVAELSHSRALLMEPTIETLITTAVSNCGAEEKRIVSPPHKQFVKPPAKAAEGGRYADVVLPDGTIELRFNEINRGGEYCPAVSAGVEQVVFGGMVFFRSGGRCYLPPLRTDGSGCCEMFVWQPDSEGFYDDKCSMRCAPWHREGISRGSGVRHCVCCIRHLAHGTGSRQQLLQMCACANPVIWPLYIPLRPVVQQLSYDIAGSVGSLCSISRYATQKIRNCYI